MAPYLHYFYIGTDQRWYGTGRNSRCVMLVPRGAKNPVGFQIRFPIAGCTHINDPAVFYAAP